MTDENYDAADGDAPIEPAPIYDGDGGDGPDESPVPGVPSGPATVAAALADPAGFADGMTAGAKVYSQFVPIPPNVLRHLLGHAFPAQVEAQQYGARHGSLVSSTDPKAIQQVRDRFGRHQLPDNPDQIDPEAPGRAGSDE